MKKVCILLFLFLLFSGVEVKAEYTLEVDPGTTPEQFFYFVDIFLEDSLLVLKTNQGRLKSNISSAYERLAEMNYLYNIGSTKSISRVFDNFNDKLNNISIEGANMLGANRDLTAYYDQITQIISNTDEAWFDYLSDGQIELYFERVMTLLMILCTNQETLDYVSELKHKFTNFELVVLGNIEQYYSVDLLKYIRDADYNFLSYSEFIERYQFNQYELLEIAKKNYYYIKVEQEIEQALESNVELTIPGPEVINHIINIDKLKNNLPGIDYNEKSRQMAINDFDYSFSDRIAFDMVAYDEIKSYQVNELLKSYIEQLDSASAFMTDGVLVSKIFYNSLRQPNVLLEAFNEEYYNRALYQFGDNGVVIKREYLELLGQILEFGHLSELQEVFLLQYIDDVIELDASTDEEIREEILYGEYYNYLRDSLYNSDNLMLLKTDKTKQYQHLLLDQFETYKQYYYAASTVFYKYMNLGEEGPIKEFNKEIRLRGLDHLRSAIFGDPNVTNIQKQLFLDYYAVASNRINNDEPININVMDVKFQTLIEYINVQMGSVFVEISQIEYDNETDVINKFEIEFNAFMKFIYENYVLRYEIFPVVKTYLQENYIENGRLNVLRESEQEYVLDLINNLDETGWVYLDKLYGTNKLEGVDFYHNRWNEYNNVMIKFYNDAITDINSFENDVTPYQVMSYFEYLMAEFDRVMENDLNGYYDELFFEKVYELVSILEVKYKIAKTRVFIPTKEEFTQIELVTNRYKIQNFLDEIELMLTIQNTTTARNDLIYDINNEWKVFLLNTGIYKYEFDELLIDEYNQINSNFETEVNKFKE